VPKLAVANLGTHRPLEPLLGPAQDGAGDPGPTRALSLFAANAWLSAARALLSMGAIWFVGCYLLIAGGRVRYPYALEWMEGGSLEHVARVLEGKPLYVAPTLEFTPFIYTPLYYWVCAPVARVFGLGLPALRVVSLAASLGLMVLLYATVHARTRDRVASLFGVGLFAACFELCGAWLDLARIDSVFLCLTAGGIYLLASSERRDVWAGLLLALAFLTKQTAVVIAAPLIAARFFTQRGLRRIELGAAFGAVSMASVLALDHASHGWFRYYVFELPRAHPWVEAMRAGHFRIDLFPHLPFAASAALYALAVPLRARNAVLLWAAAVGLIGAGWLSRLHSGGYVNVLLPSLLFVAWASAEALHSWSQRAVCARRAAFAPLLACLQLAILLYSPERYLPTTSDRAAGDALVAHLRAVDGGVLAPFDPLLPRLAGKDGSAHEMAILDVFNGGGARPEAIRGLERSIRRAVDERRYAMLVLNRDWWRPDVTARYEPVSAPLPAETALFPRTGFRTRPAQVWVPRLRDTD
jgi:hypothetical protein